MKKIIEIPATVTKQSKNTDKQYRVAAYCRVSTDMMISARKLS